MPKASAGHIFVSFFLRAFSPDCPVKTGISSCFEPMALVSELTPPLYAINVAFANTMILRDLGARK